MNYFERFQAYFEKSVAQDAAQSLSNNIEIEIQVDQFFGTLTRQSGKNAFLNRAAQDPHLTFILTPKAADAILSYESDEIAEIGEHIAQLILNNDPESKIRVKVHTGILTLLSKGYFGVIAKGGGAFASYLASKGFKNIGAIKDAISKLRKQD